jgi:hypothetical protein
MTFPAPLYGVSGGVLHPPEDAPARLYLAGECSGLTRTQPRSSSALRGGS